MFAFARRHQVVEWRTDGGPEYDLRQYEDGIPTGYVAAMAFDGRGETRPHVVHVSGQDVALVIEQAWITVLEVSAAGHRSTWLRVPFRSCVDAQLHNEPGLSGSALVRFELTVRFGRQGTMTVPMWFTADRRPQLQQLARQLVDRPGLSVPTPEAAARPLPRLDVEQAPDSGDWVVFRAHASSSEVLRGRPAAREGELLARRNGEAL